MWNLGYHLTWKSCGTSCIKHSTTYESCPSRYPLLVFNQHQQRKARNSVPSHEYSFQHRIVSWRNVLIVPECHSWRFLFWAPLWVNLAEKWDGNKINKLSTDMNTNILFFFSPFLSASRCERVGFEFPAVPDSSHVKQRLDTFSQDSMYLRNILRKFRGKIKCLTWCGGAKRTRISEHPWWIRPVFRLHQLPVSCSGQLVSPEHQQTAQRLRSLPLMLPPRILMPWNIEFPFHHCG